MSNKYRFCCAVCGWYPHKWLCNIIHMSVLCNLYVCIEQLNSVIDVGWRFSWVYQTGLIHIHSSNYYYYSSMRTLSFTYFFIINVIVVHWTPHAADIQYSLDFYFKHWKIHHWRDSDISGRDDDFFPHAKINTKLEIMSMACDSYRRKSLRLLSEDGHWEHGQRAFNIQVASH